MKNELNLPKRQASSGTHDSVLQPHPGTSQPGILGQFEGPSDDDNAAIVGFRVVPPDTNGDVGPSHYVQFINSIWAVYDKAGTLVQGPLPGNSPYAGFGGPCEADNDGDPVAKYDRLAGRWVLTQFAIPNYPDGPSFQCFAVSQTSDPTGAYNLYEFTIGSFATGWGDYPKLGIWPDGYYIAFNTFTSSAFTGMTSAAFDRTAMLAGDAATVVSFLTPPDGGGLPSDMDGTTPPPPGTPNYFFTWWDPVVGTLNVYQFHVDFATPINSTFTGPVEFGSSPFVYPPCPGGTTCVPQSGGEILDTLGDRLMNRAAYRNFGDHESIVTNQTVDAGGRTGVRWWEVRDPGGTPTVFQSGTYSPDTSYRWMASIAQDKDGNMALGYSKSDASSFPSIGITGRLVGDPVGTMGAEDVWLAGTGSQISSFSRWGDYSSMNVDPTDDCTFWYTQEYYANTNSFDFKTRIGSFKFPGCVAGASGTLEGTVTDGTNPIEGATVTAGASSTTTDAAGHYTFTLGVGTYDMTASKFGYTSDSATGVVVTDAGDTIQDFILTPNVSTVLNGVVKDGSGAGWPLYAKLDITGPVGFPPTTLYSDPVSGYYSLVVPAGFTYHFVVTSQIPGYNPASGDVAVPVPDSGHHAPNDPPGFVANWNLTVDAGVCNAPGYTAGTPVPIFSESFDGGTLPPGWSLVTNAGNPWSIVSTDPCAFFNNLTGGSGPFAVANSNCDGFISDDNELHSPSVDVSAYGGAILQFNTDYLNLGDTADVDASTDGGASWNNIWRRTASERGPILETVSIPSSGGNPGVQVRFHYYNAFFAWWWQVDNVAISGAVCNPGTGGLVVGNVSDLNTGTGLNGATVMNLPDGDSTTTFATPGDPNVPDGFYAVYAGSGPQPFQASDTGYSSQTKSTSVIPNSTVRLDFALAAGRLSASPTTLSSKVNPGETDEQTLNINNTGTADGSFKIVEVNAPLPPATKPHFQASLEDRRNAQKRIPAGRFDSKNTNHIPAMPKAPKNVPTINTGDVISSFPSNLTIGWGVGFDTNQSRVWIANPSYIGGGDDMNHSFTTDGTDTGNSIDISLAGGFWVGDQAFNTQTGKLWGVNVGGDNCLAEMDPVSLTVTGNEICGSPWTNISQRGVAYDPAADAYFVGGWNEGVIYHIDGTGAVIDSAFVGLGISGLAYNAESGHLLVMSNQPAGNDITVLDANNAYAVLGAFQVLDNGSPAFGDFQQAGMEFDCNGNLWAINQATQVVYQISAGETGACGSDIPWLSEDPTEGTVPPGGTVPVAVTFDSAGLFPGLRQAQLHITTDTPYSVDPVGVNFTVRFLDVLDNNPPGTDPYENFIYAAAGAGIMHGCSFFDFCPSALVTRADMAGYIWRSVHGAFEPPPAYTGIFSDVFFSDYNADYIQGVYDDGITAGCQAPGDPLAYCPNQSIPRGQMAVFIEKGKHFPSVFVPDPCIGIFADVPCPATPEAPFADWIEALFNDGITSGCGTAPLIFCPDQPIPNEQMAVFIVKAFGFPVLP